MPFYKIKDLPFSILKRQKVLSSFILVLFICISVKSNASESDSTSEKYCAPRILGQGPLKLFSIGYELQGSYTLESTSLLNAAGTSEKISGAGGIRGNITLPLIVKSSGIFQMGINYLQLDYRFLIGIRLIL